jgi:predicted TIM-barrel fold metal-dependent hydrolase
MNSNKLSRSKEYRINDAHIHLGPSGPRTPNFDPSTSIEQVLEFKRKNNIGKCVVFPNPSVGPKYPELNDYIIKAAKEYPKEFIPFGRIDPRYKKESKKEIKRLAGEKVAGVKLHPVVEYFRPDHPFFFDIYEEIIDYGMFVICHSSDEAFAKASHWKPVCEKFHNLKLILSHINRHALELMRNYQNVYIDTSATFNKINVDIASSDTKKIMLGSDFPYVDDLSEQIKKIEALNVPTSCKENIMFLNFDRIFSGLA